MGFFDTFKMALHNLWHNKSRTILTVVIVFVVSSLIMAMCLLGTNLLENQDRANKVMFDKTGTEYRLQIKSQQKMGGIEQEEMQSIMELSREYKDVVDCFAFTMEGLNIVYPFEDNTNSYEEMFMFADTNFMLDDDFYVSEGRIWNEADNETQGIWINEQIAKKYITNGVSCKVGETIDVGFIAQEQFNNNGSYEPFYGSIPLKIMGVLSNTKETNRNKKSFMPLGVLKSLQENIPFTLKARPYDMSFKFAPEKGKYDFNSLYSRMQSYEKSVNTLIGPGKDSGGEGKVKRFNCDFLETMQMSVFIGLAIMGVIGILAFIILLLSIGSVANTIIISVDKNKKFIGLMRAMGLKQKGVGRMVRYEASIQILLGVGLATLLMLALSPVMLSVIESLMGGMFFMMLDPSEFTVLYSLTFYIPIITFAAFVLMAILFSKGAIGKMGKADVMSIMSEVA